MSTLDERIARDCARSGVPLKVEDDALLDRVAGLLIDNSSGPAVGRRAAPPSAAAKQSKGRAQYATGP